MTLGRSKDTPPAMSPHPPKDTEDDAFDPSVEPHFTFVDKNHSKLSKNISSLQM